MKAQSRIASMTLLELSRAWPEALGFTDLRTRVRSGLRDEGLMSDLEFDQALAEMVLHSYSSGLVELHLFMPRITNRVTELPMASPLARMESAFGTVVTNLHHRNIEIKDDLGRLLLGALDGRHSRADLLSILGDRSETDNRPEAIEDAKESLGDRLERSLETLAKLALLTS